MDVSLVLFAIVEGTFMLTTRGQTNDGPNLTFLRLLRILKIVKVFRVIRAVKFVQDLRLMLDCLLSSVGQLTWCLLLIVFVLYLFALIFVQALSSYALENWDSLNEHERLLIGKAFGNVGVAMVSLFQATTGGVDWWDHYDLMCTAGDFLGATYLWFIAFFAIAAWNIVTSTFVEKTFKLALPSVDALIIEKHSRDAQCGCELLAILTEYMNKDGDGRVSLDEFNYHMTNRKVLDFFAVRGLDVKDAQSFFMMLQTMNDDRNGDDRVDLKTFVSCALRLQGSATSIDLQTLHFDVKKMFYKQTDRIKRLEESLECVIHKGNTVEECTTDEVEECTL